jgi:hypothetical protein
VSLSSGILTRNGSNQASFSVAGDEAAFSFETWPPPASFTFSLRDGTRAVPAEDFIISRLGLPLIEEERRNDWFDGNKFPWMEGVSAPVAGDARRRIFFGREAVHAETAPHAPASIVEGSTP